MPIEKPTPRGEQPTRLEASEERFRLLVESVVDYAIFILDPNGIVTTWNPGAERLKGYRAEEILGQHFSVFYTPEDRERGHPAEVLERAASLGHHVEEGWRVRKDGTRFWASLAVTALRNPDGSLNGFAKVTRDLTERKLAEEELRRAHDDLDRRVAERTAELARRTEELHRRDREKDEFVAMLAHELRNPLAPILNASQVLLARGAEDPVIRRQQQIIDRQARHMGRLLDDLLDVSRITRGKIELRRQIMDLGAAVSEAVESARSLIERRAHRLEVAVPETPVPVSADPTRLHQVIGNLLNNAAKFTDPGGRISVTVRRDGETGIVSVEDTGIGIDPETLPHIFELFAQGDRSLERAELGLGIGLTMVRRLVELHGGTVQAFSEGIGKGSRFEVRWPLGSHHHSESAGPRQPVNERGAAARVLIIDDNQDAADTLADLVGLWGYEACVAYNGPSALDVARDHRPDFVILDIGMPAMDGFEVARRLRALPGFGGVVLTALTGYGQNNDRSRATDAGFDHHLTKPVDPEELRKLLRQCSRAPVPASSP